MFSTTNTLKHIPQYSALTMHKSRLFSQASSWENQAESGPKHLNVTKRTEIHLPGTFKHKNRINTQLANACGCTVKASLIKPIYTLWLATRARRLGCHRAQHSSRLTEVTPPSFSGTVTRGNSSRWPEASGQIRSRTGRWLRAVSIKQDHLDTMILFGQKKKKKTFLRFWFLFSCSQLQLQKSRVQKSQENPRPLR